MHGRKFKVLLAASASVLVLGTGAASAAAAARTHHQARPRRLLPPTSSTAGIAGWRRWERAGRAVRWRHGWWAPVHGAQSPAGAGRWIRSDRFGVRSPGGFGPAPPQLVARNTHVTAASSAVERLGALAGSAGALRWSTFRRAGRVRGRSCCSGGERRRILPAGVGVERRRARAGWRPLALVIGRNVELGRHDGVFLGIPPRSRCWTARVGALGRRRAGAGARGGADARLCRARRDLLVTGRRGGAG